jgi:hypothetical protein
MTKDLEEYFYKTYPDLFQEHTLPPSESCMHWGITCGDGWFKILDELCGYITNYVDSFNKTVQFWRDREKIETIVDIPVKYTFRIKPVVFKQIKEKFGKLTIAYSGGDSSIDGAIDFAERISIQTCELCGVMDQTVGRTTGWIQSLCKKCAVKKGHVLDDNVSYVMTYEPTKHAMTFNTGNNPTWQLTQKNVDLGKLFIKI